MTPKEAFKGIKQAIAEHLHLKTGVSVEKHFEYLQYDTEIDIVDKAITELEELKKEISDRQETEESLGKEFIKLGDELEAIKRYPTAEEVCEEIQSELPYGTVKYIEGNQEFVFLNHGEQSNITDVYGDRYKITGFYKSSTITLIGRFYEGLGK